MVNEKKQIKKARVINIILDKYILNFLDEDEFKEVEATLRGNFKRNNNILVGDIVKVEKSYEKYMIYELVTRKNSLIRPPVSNIDNLVIVISLDSPSPDYILLDKELVLCSQKDITPVICINKVDLANGNEKLQNELKYINDVYGKLDVEIIYTSVIEKTGIHELINILRGKISAFSGNSGVGKSSITKEIMNDKNVVIGEISKRTNKGRHKTKHVQLYNIEKNTYILDTPGFSSYELYDVESKELKFHYEDFIQYVCKYEDCSHISEGINVCEIKKQVGNGNIDKGRYERYLYIHNELKQKEAKKYK
jgi:ribosome biogenesis GTPase